MATQNIERDIAVIGGGAAGLMAAIMAKRTNPFLKVTIIEHTKSLGKKLSATGNGNCNITNENIDIEHYHGGDLTLIQQVLNDFSLDDTINFFNSIGVVMRIDENGRMYPYSMSAKSVLNAMLAQISSLKIEVIYDCEISAISKENYRFLLCCEEYTIRSDKVILACGGLSASKTGSDGKALKLYKTLDLKVSKLFPAIVPLRSDDKILPSIQGYRVYAGVRLMSGEKELCTKYGQVQFLNNGVSGICVFELARLVNENSNINVKFGNILSPELSVKKDNNIYLSIDLMPEYQPEQIYNFLESLSKQLSEESVECFLQGIFQKRIALAVLKLADILPLTRSCESISPEELEILVHTIKNFKISILSTFSYDKAQVTAGGLVLSQFKDKLECKNISGLYACGEALDADGDCGGYNLQWAWSSGAVAGRSAAKLKPTKAYVYSKYDSIKAQAKDND